MSETLSSTRRLREALRKEIDALPDSLLTNRTMLVETLVKALSLPEREARDGYTLVPDSALRWLFGEEGDFAPPTEYGQAHAYKRPYWWRSEFRKRIEAAQSVQPAPGAGETEGIPGMLHAAIALAKIGEIPAKVTVSRWEQALRSASPVHDCALEVYKRTLKGASPVAQPKDREGR